MNTLAISIIFHNSLANIAMMYKIFWVQIKFSDSGKVKYFLLSEKIGIKLTVICISNDSAIKDEIYMALKFNIII